VALAVMRFTDQRFSHSDFAARRSRRIAGHDGSAWMSRWGVAEAAASQHGIEFKKGLRRSERPKKSVVDWRRAAGLIVVALIAGSHRANGLVRTWCGRDCGGGEDPTGGRWS